MKALSLMARWATVDTDETLTIGLRRKQRGTALVMLGFVLGVSVAWGGVFVWFWQEGRPYDFLGTVTCLGFVAIFSVAAFFVCIAYIFEWEKIDLCSQFLSIERHLLGIGRRQRFHLPQVQGIRLEPPVAIVLGRAWAPGRANVDEGRIVFDYGGHTYRFGLDLNRSEAQLLLALIKERLATQGTPGSVPASEPATDPSPDRSELACRASSP